jgi:hypothetical protein
MAKKEEKNPLFGKMVEYGIAPPASDDKAELKKKLIQLRDAILLRGKIQTPQVGAEEFAGDYFDRMGKLNPRRRRSRRNPLTSSEVDMAVEYAKDKTKVAEGLQRAFERLPDSSKWELTQEEVEELLPQRSRGRGTWSPVARLRELETRNMVSRVGSPPEALLSAGRRGAVDPETLRQSMPFENNDVMALMASSAGLSLDDVTGILEVQSRAQREFVTKAGGPQRRSMQPSSAICKLHRKRRLSGYSPPAGAVAKAGGTLIWMSPTTAYTPRVMTFRRGVHLDCDMVGKGPEDMPELLGRAIQAMLLWLVEKGGGMKGRLASDVYAGRVGQPDLYLVYKAGEAVSIDRVTGNLQRAQKGEPGYRLSIVSDAKAVATGRETGLQQDTKAYMAAVQSQFGSAAGREVASGERTVMGTESAAPAAQVIVPEERDWRQAWSDEEG